VILRSGAGLAAHEKGLVDHALPLLGRQEVEVLLDLAATAEEAA
jgi:hypothetical protein